MASRGNRNLSSLDNFMLDYYIVRYTEISNRINELYSELHSIHENIENIHENNRNEPFYSHNQRRTRTQPRRNSMPSSLSRNENSIQGPRNDVRNLFSNFFTNVPVVPTAQQIAQATRIVQYGTINNPLNEACPISLERFRNEDLITQINHCGHLFDSEEVIEWFQNNVRCPVCRYDIRNYSPSTEEQEQEPQPQTLTTSPANNSSILERISQQLLVSFLNNSDDRIVFDASNNIFVYETTFHANI